MKYPLYVISKGRWENPLTAKFLLRDKIDFKIVIEPQEEEKYAKVFGKKQLYILPFSNLGLGSIPARNWCWEHSLKSGAKRHWILDDNIRGMMKLVGGKRKYCHSREGFEKIEDFIDRYSNIAVAGISYHSFGFMPKMPPFYLNKHVYSTLLILNEIPFRWRGRYNEDTDLCLQVLTKDWCTVNMNAYLMIKMATLKCKGGNTDELYAGKGRLKMARTLEHQWMTHPGLVKTIYRFKRAQHFVDWKRFRQPLKKISDEQR